MKDWEAAYIAGIIDGEGSITLTRLHKGENRRPCISISSNDKEMLVFIQGLTGGVIYSKKNYNPEKHKDSFALYIKKKTEVFYILKKITKFLRVDKKRNRAMWILDHYNTVTPRNGKYTEKLLIEKKKIEMLFFEI